MEMGFAAELVEKHLQLQDKKMWVDGLGLCYQRLFSTAYVALPETAKAKGVPSLHLLVTKNLSRIDAVCLTRAKQIFAAKLCVTPTCDAEVPDVADTKGLDTFLGFAAATELPHICCYCTERATNGETSIRAQTSRCRW